MTAYKLNPLTDPRWPEFTNSNPEAFIFHTREWLNAIHLTYGYEPVVFTTSQEKTLSNAVVFCHIRSWLTGTRLVSLPFSDHCQPLAKELDLETILSDLENQRRSKKLKYVELRPLENNDQMEARFNFSNSESFYFQKINLRPDVDAIYKNFHDSCIRRKIRRAGRENLVYESGRTEELLKKFRHLLLLTRRRHRLPPQPASWFQNIVHCLGEMVTIHVLSKDGIPVSSVITLTYKKSMIYKYGCSDAHFNSMGGTPLLFWKVIQQAKEMGIEEFDLGRSGYEDQGLIAFKEHLGAISSTLKYYRNPAPQIQRKRLISGSAWARQAMVRLPDPLLAGIGQLLYRHIG